MKGISLNWLNAHKAFNWNLLRDDLRRFFRTDDPWENDELLRKSLGRLGLIRVAIVSVILAIKTWMLLSGRSGEQNLSIVFYAIALTFALSAVNGLLLRAKYSPRLLRYPHLLTDIAISCAMFYVSISAASVFLLLLVIVEAAVLFHKHAPIIVASLCALCYALAGSGLLPRLRGAALSADMQEISLVYISFIVVALVSAYIAEHIRMLGRIARSHERNLDELEKKQQRVFDEVSEGIVTLDMDAVVLGINQAAKAIIGLSKLDPETVIGKKLPSLLQQAGVLNADKAIEQSASLSNPLEMKLSSRVSGQDLHLSYMVRPLTDSTGQETGKLFIFNDVSHVRDMEDKLHLHEKMTKLLASSDATSVKPERTFKNVHIIGESPVMKHIFQLVDRLASSDASVLITGESGTGKELIAKAIHSRGCRAAKSFVAVNCGAIPENLIESEFFGHKKGSFTGAINDSPGLFRQAHGGTIFLDEIGDLPMHLQTKLLRVLQEKKVRAVGDVHDNPVDVRVLAATNRDLKKDIAAGRFREDLYYRLNVVNIMVPPLRDRKDDIALLVRYFIGRYCDQDKVLPQISPEALHLLANYAFPGNIRELENVIERAIVLGGQAILPEHLPQEVRTQERPQHRADGGQATQVVILPLNLEGELEKLEKELLLKALEEAGGVRKRAANLLGLNFRSFRYRLKKYGIADEHDAQGLDGEN